MNIKLSENVIKPLARRVGTAIGAAVITAFNITNPETINVIEVGVLAAAGLLVDLFLSARERN